MSLREFSQCALRLVFSGTELYSLPHAVARRPIKLASRLVHCGRYTAASLAVVILLVYWHRVCCSRCLWPTSSARCVCRALRR